MLINKKIVFFSFMMSSLASATEPLPKSPPIPKDNSMSAAKVELGKQLFFDPRLSKDGTVSCNSCHNVMAGGEDNRNLSAGVGGKLGARSSPTVWNAAFQSVQFWDGRAATLEEQAKGPLLNPVEMAMPDHDAVMARIKNIPGYMLQFKKIFGAKDPATIGNFAKAVAAYERTLITPNAPFDQFKRGKKNALSASQKQGWNTFQRVGCTSCHNGVNFSGPSLSAGTGFFMKFPTFEDIALENQYGFKKDNERYDVTKNEGDRNMYRVPSLRNVALTAPYFHNGAVKTLSEAVRVMGKLQLNRDLSQEEIGSIVAFLGSLTGTFPKQTMPRLPATTGGTLTP